MKIRIRYEGGGLQVDEEFAGSNAEAVVTAMQRAAARQAGFAVRFVINAMSPIQFAREAVNRYNQAMKRSLPAPNSCSEFLALAEQEGFATTLEP